MSSQANRPLPEGFRLEKFRILRVLASGGFSFVYLAHDESEMPVALKEYLPAWLALRAGECHSPTVPTENLATFRHGMKCFFEEGRALATLRHPNVVRVLDFFRANGTAYLAMRYERGRSLDEHIRKRRGALSEEWIRSTFTNLLKGLREVHSNKLLHLDVKPGNIYIRNDGVPLLIDFGAARQALSVEDSPLLRQICTPGFASPEHYGARQALGPWSDVYSVGASMYACVAAGAPPPASARTEHDRMIPARRGWAGKYSPQLLETIDWCLRLNPMERPQSVFTLQKALSGERAPAIRREGPGADSLEQSAPGFSVA